MDFIALVGVTAFGVSIASSAAGKDESETAAKQVDLSRYAALMALIRLTTPTFLVTPASLPNVASSDRTTARGAWHPIVVAHGASP
jgi:hypothetical protein